MLGCGKSHGYDSLDLLADRTIIDKVKADFRNNRVSAGPFGLLIYLKYSHNNMMEIPGKD